MKNKIVLNGLLIMILGIFFTGCVSNTPPISNSVANTGDSSVSLNDDDYVKIPLSDISSTMKKYSLDANGIKVNYLRF